MLQLYGAEKRGKNSQQKQNGGTGEMAEFGAQDELI